MIQLNHSRLLLKIFWVRILQRTSINAGGVYLNICEHSRDDVSHSSIFYEHTADCDEVMRLSESNFKVLYETFWVTGPVPKCIPQKVKQV